MTSKQLAAELDGIVAGKKPVNPYEGHTREWRAWQRAWTDAEHYFFMNRPEIRSHLLKETK